MVSTKENLVEFSGPFINSAQDTFKDIFSEKLEIGLLQVKEDHKSQNDIFTVLGLIGECEKSGKREDYRAMLVISWSYETYTKIAEALLGEKITEYSEEIAHVGGEIVNMIVENAKHQFSKLGYTSQPAIPSVIEGKNQTINYPDDTTILSIPLKSAHGKLEMEICYSENAWDSDDYI